MVPGGALSRGVSLPEDHGAALAPGLLVARRAVHPCTWVNIGAGNNWTRILSRQHSRQSNLLAITEHLNRALTAR